MPCLIRRFLARWCVVLRSFFRSSGMQCSPCSLFWSIPWVMAALREPTGRLSKPTPSSRRDAPPDWTVCRWSWCVEAGQTSHSTTKHLKRSSNFECVKNLRSSNDVEFEFELRHISNRWTRQVGDSMYAITSSGALYASRRLSKIIVFVILSRFLSWWYDSICVTIETV